MKFIKQIAKDIGEEIYFKQRREQERERNKNLEFRTPNITIKLNKVDIETIAIELEHLQSEIIEQYGK